MSLRLKHGLIIVFVTLISTMLLWIPAGIQTIYQNYDGPYYLVVAKTWYDKSLIGRNFSFPLPNEYFAAHFPLYPLLIKSFQISGINQLQSMLVVNILGAIVGSNILYQVAQEKKFKYPLFIALAWLFFWPRMWAVRSIGSPETIFISLVMLSLYSFEKKRFWLAGICGALATLTKSPGVLLLPTYAFWIIANFFITKKWEWKAYPVIIIGLALGGLFWFFGQQMGDYWAYFNSGDNLHLQLLPFKVFDSKQAWVGNWWLEDVLWVYFLGLAGVVNIFKKNSIWGWWGVMFLTVIIFVSHRDISRYSLPLVPVILLGLGNIWGHKTFRWIAVIMLIPIYFYSLNFITNNIVNISDWTPFL